MTEDIRMDSSFKVRVGMEMRFTSVTVKIKDKLILQKVSGLAKPGEVLAMMGPSGSGKTTLLNVLAGRRTEVQNGTVHINGNLLNKRLRRKICYVLQEDIFFENLTLREQLVYTARLRLPGAAPLSIKMEKVNEIVDLLDIRKCLDTKIGNLESKGLSGGEKKRANIGCELMTDPAILVLDEPTSGLDSFAAYNLMTTLKNFASTLQKTIVLSVHQPSSQIFYMFDHLLLLHEGETVYFGKASKVVDYFAGIGFPCNKHYNPADFILEKTRGGESEVKTIMDAGRNASWEALETADIMHGTEAEQDIDAVNKDFHANSTTHLKDQDKDADNGPKWPTTYTEQYSILTVRSFKEVRHKLISPVMLVETLSVAIIMSLIWFQMKHTEEMIDDRAGVIFMAVCMWSFTPMYLGLSVFPQERVVINKERMSGLYHLSAYFMGKQTSEFPLTIFLPLLGYTVVYFASGLNTWPPAFFLSMSVMLLSALLGQSMGMFFGLLFDDLNNGLTFEGLLIMYCLVVAGFYIKSFPPWLQWTKYLSYLYYMFHSMLIIEFTNNKPIVCNREHSNFAECAAYNGSNVVEIQPESILDFYEVEFPVWFNVCVIIALSIIFRIVSYLLLRYYRKPDQG
ncbi:uncharacterized protein [Ptychodera flava]|uniref:uncharacterized protein n=1 Tax=Ptychodera flava TaxID=63121 RepID=UPI00396A75AD